MSAGHPKVNSYPFYSPRFWAGMRVSDYLALLSANRFRITPLRYAMTGLVGGCSVASSALALAQDGFYGRRLRHVDLPPPIFVVGHWRSGTTLLHEMLALDSRLIYPNTFQCFVPTHFLASRFFLEPLVRLLLPRHRPMDKMRAGPQLPQEDEFALLAMGAPSPYRFVAFCHEPPPYLEMLDLEGAKDSDVERVRAALTQFYRAVSLTQQGRLVVKSPTHTGRMKALSEWFPGARFVHISRHPYKIVPSTNHLWRSLATVQGYQLPSKDDAMLEHFANECFRRTYRGYFRDRDALPAGSLVEVRYEDLVDDPMATMEHVYQTLELGEFDALRPQLQEYWSARQDHRRNRLEIDDETKDEIDARWHDYLVEFGYAPVTRTG